MKQFNNFKVLVFSAAALSMILLSSCGGDDKVTNNTQNSDCGSHHTLSYGPLSAYTNTYLEDTIRVFQFSAIPFSSISNICTHGKPLAKGTSSWTFGGPTISAALVVNIGAGLQPYRTPGTYALNGIFMEWDGTINVGLQQAFGNGPGEIYDLRIDISFRTQGTLALDEQYLTNSGVRCSMTLDYDEYSSLTAIKKDVIMNNVN